MISGTTTDGAIMNGVVINGVIKNGVILAENDALMRGIIRAVLLRAEQQVFPVGNGAEAVALAQQFRARLVLLDIAMPRLNGLLACEAIRALPDYAEVPIVMLTGHDDERFRLAARRVGANDFIVKPFQPNALLARLAAYLDIPQRTRPAAAPAGADTLPGVPAQMWESHAAARAATGDHAQPGNRALVWKPREMPGPELGEHSQLITGREVLRIQRDAERSC
jgi:DNA-binding response OmpR family regulator